MDVSTHTLVENSRLHFLNVVYIVHFTNNALYNFIIVVSEGERGEGREREKEGVKEGGSERRERSDGLDVIEYEGREGGMG